MSIDVPRLLLLGAGALVGVCVFVFAPDLGERLEAFSETVVLVFTILAGIQLAVFALLGGLHAVRFRRGTSTSEARLAVGAKTIRQLFLFYAYFLVMAAILIDKAFDLGAISTVLERGYVALAFATLVWSLGLPVALARIQSASRG